MKDIYYQVTGQGFPVVFLHGNGEDHHIFDQAVNLLSKQYQCICIDSRYHGRSVHAGELSYQQMCQDVMAVMDELNITAYDVIGFSDGGIVSLMLGMQDSRLKHIISIGANTKPRYIKRFYRLTFYLQMICLAIFSIYQKKARLTFRLYKLMLTQPQIEYKQLQQIHVPVLVLAGEFDMIDAKDTDHIGESLPYGIVKIIQHGNHFLLRDAFQETVKEISLFLEACHQEENYEHMSSSTIEDR